MDTTSTPLPAELKSILPLAGGEPLRLVDDDTQKVYFLIEQSPTTGFDEEAIRRLLAEADDDIARGDIADWNVDEARAEARRIFRDRQDKRRS